MLKGVVLGICIAVFIVSLAFAIFGITENLNSKSLTGSVVGGKIIASYSAIIFVLSLLIGFIILMNIRKQVNARLEELSDEDKANKEIGYILKVSSDKTISDEQAAGIIADEIKKTESEPYFPHFFDRLDPDQFYPETKLLEDYEKQRLRRAFDKYFENSKRNQ